jgi:hypothetical protein
VDAARLVAVGESQAPFEGAGFNGGFLDILGRDTQALVAQHQQVGGEFAAVVGERRARAMSIPLAVCQAPAKSLAGPVQTPQRSATSISKLFV